MPKFPTKLLTLPRRGVPPPPISPTSESIPSSQLPTIMSDSHLSINCWILGHGYEEVFSVEISEDKNVDALRQAIKTESQNTLSAIDAVSLILYKVSIPYSPQLAEHAAALGVNKLRLMPLDKLSKVFENGLVDAHVHVIVEIPSGAWVYVVLSSLR
jgi:Crinkler effector protein N-terminal domain